jgi:hypothetical protein
MSEAPSCRCEHPRLWPDPAELLPSTCTITTGNRVVTVRLERCLRCRRTRATRSEGQAANVGTSANVSSTSLLPPGIKPA